MTKRKRDRGAILKRRAVFVGSALSTLTGCSQQQKQPNPEPPAVSVASTPSATASPTASTATAKPAPMPPVEGKMPPLETPKDVTGTARSEFERLIKELPKVHAKLDTAEKELADICSIEKAACESRWKTVAKQLALVDESIRELPPLCPGSSDGAKKFDAWMDSHLDFLRKRKAAIEKHAETILQSDAGKQRWKAELAAAAIPQPCLDYGCNDW